MPTVMGGGDTPPPSPSFSLPGIGKKNSDLDTFRPRSISNESAVGWWRFTSRKPGTRANYIPLATRTRYSPQLLLRKDALNVK